MSITCEPKRQTLRSIPQNSQMPRNCPEFMVGQEQELGNNDGATEDQDQILADGRFWFPNQQW